MKAAMATAEARYSLRPAAVPGGLRGANVRVVRREDGRRAPQAIRRSIRERQSRMAFAIHFVPALLLFLTLVFQLWIRVGIIEASYALESTRQSAVNKDAEVRKLRSDLAVLTSPRILAERAKKELGMILPPARSVRKIGKK